MFRKDLYPVFVALAVWGACFPSSRVRADDKYYMMLFSSQSDPKEVRVSHTFAEFVKVADDSRIVERHGISWMPRDLEIRPLRRLPEPGVNLSLAQTQHWAGLVGARVTMWGPFRIRPELYHMAVRQERRLNSGAASYIAMDRRYREDGTTNCIHAVSDLDQWQPPLSTGTAFGDEATVLVLNHFQRYILPTPEPTRWLTDLLNVKPDKVRFATAIQITGGNTKFGP